MNVIRDAYRQNLSQDQLIQTLDEFFIENELYRDVPESKAILERIRAENLELIAYKVFA